MQALFDQHLDWVASIARAVGRGLPPSFDPEELGQVALIQHWRCVESYDAGRNDNYQAFAYLRIRGAVLMACRRRNYREATHKKLGGFHVDRAARPDEILLAREEYHNRLGPRIYRQRVKVRAAIALLAPEDAYLVRLVFVEGADVDELEHGTPGIKRQIAGAVRRLKRLVRDGTPAATVTRPVAAQLVGECA